MRSAAFALVALLAGTAAAQVPDFYAHWGDGKAEISSYRVIQPRYGEPREGYGVLIFVTEEINRNTFIKVESPTPVPDRIYVLKLNNVLKFTTGIYPYSAMTSVFSAVEGHAGGGPFELCKISLSSQEWCGHVFDEVQVRDGRLRGDLNSYFESEGKHPYELAMPEPFQSEDHLLITIRELKGPVVEAGVEREIMLLPSLWSLRLQHRSHTLVSTTLRKGRAASVALRDQTFAAVPWTWGDRTVWVEQAYPHRILKWESGDGGSGELITTLREPYWKLKRRQDEEYRVRLGIAGG